MALWALRQAVLGRGAWLVASDDQHLAKLQYCSLNHSYLVVGLFGGARGAGARAMADGPFGEFSFDGAGVAPTATGDDTLLQDLSDDLLVTVGERLRGGERR